MSKIFVFILSVLLLESGVNSAVPNWPGHDSTLGTLRLLQIVHRHGERNVLKGNLPSTDPFQNVTQYWWEGYGQLTTKGKSRMYRIGNNLRQWYSDYLAKDNSPRHVYARSSVESRCIESLSSLLSGMYKPEGKWVWDDNEPLAKLWQPFPIDTFMPKDEDTLLVPHKKCPKATEEHQKITDSEDVQRILHKLHNSTMYTYMKDELFKESIDYLYRGQQFWDTLKIETELGRTWDVLNGSGKYTQEQIIDELEPLGLGSYIYDWNRPFILKIRVGKLIETLIENMKSVIKGQSPEDKKQLYIYSTHDTIVVPLMQALGDYNNKTPPYGGGLLIELHEGLDDNKTHSVRIYSYGPTNENDSPDPFLGVKEDLSLHVFEDNNKKYYYSDFDKECGIKTKSSSDLLLSEMTFMVIGMGIGIGLLGLNIFAFKYIRQRKNTFRITK